MSSGLCCFGMFFYGGGACFEGVDVHGVFVC